MAAMGKRDITKNEALKSLGSARQAHPMPVAGLNLIIRPTQIQPVVAQPFMAPTIGLPIMREGFVTDTGFLLGHLF